MVRIWDAQIEATGRLPVIIPLVVYHGQANWNIKPALSEMISGYDELPPDIKVLIPDYAYLLYDLSRFTDEEIKGRLESKIAMTVLRDIMKKDLDAVLKSLYLLRELKDKGVGSDYFDIVMRYIFSARSDLTIDNFTDLVKKIETVYPEGSEKVMTLAELFRQEGLEKGLEKGLEEGLERGMEKGETNALSRTVIKFLVRKFDFVPEDLKQGISKLDAPTLDKILDRVFDFENLDEVRKYIKG